MEAASLLDAVERWSEPLAVAAIVVFSCVLGANLGSFLNVIMYRVPRGESVALGGSRCPSCGSRVRWRDNVPVIGWLLLGGRCRDCRGAISVRYPVIEAAAGMVGAVVAGELLAGGRLMPGSRFAAVRPGADALLTHPDWSFVVTCVAHGALLMTLLAWAVCEFDRLRVAWSWFAAALAAWVGTSICLGGPTVPTGWPAVAMVGAGIGAGLMAGALVPNVWLRQCLVIVGAALGWQALLTSVAIMPLAAIVRISVASGVGPKTLRATGPGCVDLALAVAVQVLAWRWLDGIWIGHGPTA